MKRFSLIDLVQLPRMDAATTVALARTLLTLAEDKKKLPAGIAQAKRRLAAVHKDVAEALAQRLMAPTSDPQRAKIADQGEDLAFSALFDFLTGWSKLPADFKQAEIARRLLLVLFPTGLRFLQLTFHQEWAEAQARLDRIEKEGLDAHLKTLGGEPFLLALRAAHKEYGEALGVTQVRSETSKDGASVRESLSKLQGTLRKYVVQVVAQVEEDDAASAELAEELLSPLAEYQAKIAKPQAPESPQPDPTLAVHP